MSNEEEHAGAIWSVIPFYEVSESRQGTHLTISAHGRPRFIVPRKSKWLHVVLRGILPWYKYLGGVVQHWRSAKSGQPSLLENELLSDLREFLGIKAFDSLAYIGTPGPYSKNTVFFLGPDHVGPVVKVGASEAAANLLKNEAETLGLFKNHHLLADTVPSVLWSGDWKGMFLVVLSYLKGVHVGPTFSRLIRQYLSSLGEMSFVDAPFIGSKMHHGIIRRSEQLSRRLSHPWNETIDRGIDVLEGTLQNHSGMVLSHRDFSYWNIRKGGNGLKVFDWEYASNEYLASYDMFHFYFHRIALERKWDRSAVESAKALGDDIGKNILFKTARNTRAELIGYLLDLALTYLESTDGDDSRSVVLQNYYSFINELCGQREVIKR